ncbi:MAG: hydrogenase maturation protease [Bacillota bacterium]
MNEGKRLLVLGIGNRLCRDDGIGSVLAERLSHRTEHENVDIIDGGTIGLGLLYLFESYSDVIIIDSTDAGAEPGTLIWYSLHDLEATEGEGKVSHHQSGVLDLLSHARLMGCLPKNVILLGIQVAAIEPEMGLSEEMRERLPMLETCVEEEIGHWLKTNA